MLQPPHEDDPAKWERIGGDAVPKRGLRLSWAQVRGLRWSGATALKQTGRSAAGSRPSFALSVRAPWRALRGMC